MINSLISQLQQHLSSLPFSDISGSTLCIIILIGNKLLSINVGDSRAVMFSSSKISPLTIDHKPTSEKEIKRIESCGGEVKKKENGDVVRVWKRGANLIGLGMTRSMGDCLAKKIGVVSEAEIREVNINSDTYFILIASDGIWEVLSTEEVYSIRKANLIGNNVEKTVCEELYKRAKEKFITTLKYVDDISIIFINFTNKM